MQDEPSEQSQVSNLSRDPCNARSKTWDSLGSGRRATTDEPTRSPVRTGDLGVFQLELLERRQPANLRWDATCTIVYTAHCVTNGAPLPQERVLHDNTPLSSLLPR